MKFLKRRVSSKNKIEKFLGFVFYGSAFLCLMTCQVGFTYFLNIITIPQNWILFLMTLFFLLTLMDTTNDFDDIEKKHKGTLDYFITKINPVKSIAKSCFLFFVIPPILIVYVSIIEHSFSPFLFFIQYIFCIFILCITINAINNIPVAPEELNVINDLEDINDDEKFLLKKGVSDIIIEHGYVSRGTLEEKVSNVLSLKKKRIEENKKKETKDQYSKFIIPNSGYYGNVFYLDESGEEVTVKIKFPESTPRNHVQKWIEQYRYCDELLKNCDIGELEELNIDSTRGIFVEETKLYIPLIFEKENPLKIKKWAGYSIQHVNEVGETVNVSKSP